MSYQRLATPKIYTCNIQYLLSLGKIATSDITASGLSMASGSSLIEMFDMKPSNVQTITANGTNTAHYIKMDTNISTDSSQDANFVAILGHNFDDAGVKFRVQTDDDTNFGSAQTPTMTEVVNCDITSAYCAPDENGWTLFTFTQATDNLFIRIEIQSQSGNYDADIVIGAILVGETQTVFPSSPDMNITKKLLYDGVTRQNSVGGQTFSNASHLTKPNWGNYNPWENKTSSTLNPMTTSGRIQLDMNYSYMADTDVWFENHYDRADLASQNNIVSNLIQRTHSGHIPFIFQFDKDTATANDSFMLCRLANEPTFSQVAHRTWNCDISLIEEF